MTPTSRKRSKPLHEGTAEQTTVASPEATAKDQRRRDQLARAALLASTVDKIVGEVVTTLDDLRSEVRAMRRDLQRHLGERRLLTVEAAAEQWSVSAKRVRRWIKEGMVRTVQLGDVVRIDTSEEGPPGMNDGKS